MTAGTTAANSMRFNGHEGGTLDYDRMIWHMGNLQGDLA